MHIEVQRPPQYTNYIESMCILGACSRLLVSTGIDTPALPGGIAALAWGEESPVITHGDIQTCSGKLMYNSMFLYMLKCCSRSEILYHRRKIQYTNYGLCYG